MFTQVVPEILETHADQMDAIVGRLSSAIMAYAPATASVVPAGGDEGSWVGMVFSNIQGSDMWMADHLGWMSLFGAANALHEASSDYLRDDAISASAML